MESCQTVLSECVSLCKVVKKLSWINVLFIEENCFNLPNKLANIGMLENNTSTENCVKYEQLWLYG